MGRLSSRESLRVVLDLAVEVEAVSLSPFPLLDPFSHFTVFQKQWADHLYHPFLPFFRLTLSSPKPTDTGAIVGGAVGGAVGLALIGALIWFLLRRKRKNEAEEFDDMMVSAEQCLFAAEKREGKL